MPPSVPHSDIDVNALMRGLVHELRNPLSAILTASSLLQSGEGIDEESAMLIDVVQKESRRMNRILTEFSSFVKPPQSHPEVFDIAKALRNLTREMQKEEALLPNIEIRDELPAELLVLADPVQSSQAFHHILTNAAQAMENGGTLRLLTKNEGACTIIVLEDSGAGLSEQELQRVFQPFFSTKPAATGLGLSIASGLLRASGGTVLVENRDSNGASAGGARVCVQLPSAENFSLQSSA
jgi:signal transduction histidine kinase